MPIQVYGMLEAAEDEHARLGDEEYQRAKEVMREKYAGVDLATLSARPENPVGEMGQESAYISRAMVDGWCKGNGFAPYQLFQAAFSYVLARLLREEKVAYTTIYHGRRDQRVRQAYGMFVRTIPFIMEIRKEQTVLQYINAVHTEMKATLSQLAYPFSHFCRDMGVQPGISFNFTALPGWEEEYHFGETHCPFVQQDRGDVFHDLLAHIFIVGAGVVPAPVSEGEYYDIRMESSPIDEVARAIMLLATTPEECTVFHPYNIHRQYLADILNGFAAAGITLRHVEKEEFQEALERMMENPDLVTLLRPLMAYNLSSTHRMRWIEADNDYTTQVLYRFGFLWPTTARDYVHRFVDTIIGFDYFNIPTS